MTGLRIAIAGAGGRMGRMLLEATLKDAQRRWWRRSTSLARQCTGQGCRRAGRHALRRAVSSDAPRESPRPLPDRLHPPRGHAHHLESCRRRRGAAWSSAPPVFRRRRQGGDCRRRRGHPGGLRAEHERRRQRRFSSCSTWRPGSSTRATTSRSSRRTTATRSMRPREPRCAWARWSPALGRDAQDACAIYGREGVTGERRQTIGFSTIRGGDIVGDHTVLFCRHRRAHRDRPQGGSRMPYAQRAACAPALHRAAQVGLFDMQDVLGLR
jgi:4-hydroxy-tetrahydrodipicolinate reductase